MINLARDLTNRSVQSSNAMWEGGVSCQPLRHASEGASWKDAGPLQRRVVKHFFDIHLSDVRAGRRLCEGKREQAFFHVTKSENHIYNGGPDEHNLDTLPKGAICPLVVNELSIPPPGVAPVDPTLHSATLSHYYTQALDTMVRSDCEVDWDLHSSLQIYNDPALDDPAVMQELLLRFFDAGMLGHTTSIDECLDLFAVVKSEPSPDTDEAIKSRIVWDLRRTNLRFNRPPKMPLGSAASLSFLELSPEMLGEGNTPPATCPTGSTASCCPLSSPRSLCFAVGRGLG